MTSYSAQQETKVSGKLTYKELQQALKSYKEQGLTGIKLNSKMEVLQEEYNRLTNKTVESNNNNYPFCSNTVKVENKLPAASNDKLFTTKVLRAMDSKYAPSWLCKPYVVYVIDGVDYLQGELEAQLQGQVCELPAVANARQPQPIINTASDKPKVAVTFKAQEEYSPYFIDTHHNRFTKTLGSTELQAARNLQDAISATKQGLKNVISFAKGFHARQVERTLKVA